MEHGLLLVEFRTISQSSDTTIVALVSPLINRHFLHACSSSAH
ncbi:hypothetical protein HMPREF1550_02460 [Actinomyces sp. oral taxon 877 str. F0543]|nr:hypothetical protein HMPREF1550_02460 [Actinomyces sp. oral taxon 877 str. F0543]